MIDHITLHISNFETSRDFYASALGPLGIGAVLILTATILRLYAGRGIEEHSHIKGD